jgi:hypothetical protein
MITSAVSLDNAGRYLDEAVEAEAIDQFVARVLCRAHRSAEARNAPSEARAILDLAQMFADELIARDPAFDRFAFVEAATEGPA